MDTWFKVLRGLTWLAQLGLSLATPLLICLFGAHWLQMRFGLGGWIMAVGIVLGIGGAFSGAVQFYRMVQRQADKGKKDKPDAFNTHE